MTAQIQTRLADFCALPRDMQEAHLRANPQFGQLFADALATYRTGKAKLGRNGYGATARDGDSTFVLTGASGACCFVAAAMLGESAPELAKSLSGYVGVGKAACLKYGHDYSVIARVIDGFDAGRAVLTWPETSPTGDFTATLFGAEAYIFAESEFGPAVNLLEVGE